MSEQLQTRSLEVIGAEIRALTASMLGNVIEIGRRMVEAKELLPHGEFGPWIKENTGYSHSTANNFMRLYNEYGNPQQSLFGAEVEKSQTFGKLSYTKALALLALPTEAEREEFVETHDMDGMSTRELEQAIRERDEARKRAEEAEAETKRAKAFEKDLLNTIGDANDRVDRLAKELVAAKEELEKQKARPVEVAVQEPDPEIVQKKAEALAAELAKEARDEAEIERRAAASAQKAQAAAEQAAVAAKAEADQALKKAKEKAKAEREKLEAKLKAAEEKLSTAGAEDRSAAEQLRATVESLKKELAMSGQEITTFRLRFSAWQEAYRAMREALGAVSEEQRGKMAAAARAQAKAWAEE